MSAHEQRGHSDLRPPRKNGFGRLIQRIKRKPVVSALLIIPPVLAAVAGLLTNIDTILNWFQAKPDRSISFDIANYVADTLQDQVTHDPLSLRYQAQPGTPLRIMPHLGYLDLLDSGGPIDALPRYFQFTIPYPTLDVNVVNNSPQTIRFSEAVLHVQSSKLDPTPLFVFRGVGSEMRLPLENYGWGQVSTCTLRFNLVSMTDSADFDKPFAYVIDAASELNSDKWIDLSSAFVKAGVDVTALHTLLHLSMVRGSGRFGKYTYSQANGNKITVNGDEFLARIKKASGPFGASVDEQDIERAATVRVYGEVRYATQGDGDVAQKKAFRFVASVLLGIETRSGVRPPVSASYNAQLEVDSSGYDIRVPISQDLVSGAFDRFTIALRADKSSIHELTLSLVYNRGRTLTSQPIHINLISPKRGHAKPLLAPIN